MAMRRCMRRGSAPFSGWPLLGVAALCIGAVCFSLLQKVPIHALLPLRKGPAPVSDAPLHHQQAGDAAGASIPLDLHTPDHNLHYHHQEAEEQRPEEENSLLGAPELTHHDGRPPTDPSHQLPSDAHPQRPPSTHKPSQAWRTLMQLLERLVSTAAPRTVHDALGLHARPGAMVQDGVGSGTDSTDGGSSVSVNDTEVLQGGTELSEGGAGEVGRGGVGFGGVQEQQEGGENREGGALDAAGVEQRRYGQHEQHEQHEQQQQQQEEEEEREPGGGGAKDSQLSRALSALRSTCGSVRTWLSSELLATRMALDGAAHAVHAARNNPHVRALEAAVRDSALARTVAPHACAAARAVLRAVRAARDSPLMVAARTAVARAASYAGRQLAPAWAATLHALNTTWSAAQQMSTTAWAAALRVWTTASEGLSPVMHTAQQAAVAAVTSCAHAATAAHGRVVRVLAAWGVGTHEGAPQVVVLLLTLAVSLVRGAWVYGCGLLERQWQQGYDAALAESQSALTQAHADLHVSKAAAEAQQAQEAAQHAQQLQQVTLGAAEAAKAAEHAVQSTEASASARLASQLLEHQTELAGIHLQHARALQQVAQGHDRQVVDLHAAHASHVMHLRAAVAAERDVLTARHAAQMKAQQMQHARLMKAWLFMRQHHQLVCRHMSSRAELQVHEQEVREERLRRQLVEVQTKHSQACGTIADMSTQIENLQSSLEDAEYELAARSQQLLDASSSIRSKDQLIAQHKSMMNELQQRLQDLDESLHQSERHVQSLEAEIREAQARCESGQQQVQGLQEELSGLPRYEARLAEAVEQLEALLAQHGVLQEEVGRAHACVAEREAQIKEQHRLSQEQQAAHQQRERDMQQGIDARGAELKRVMEAKDKQLQLRQADNKMLKEELTKVEADLRSLRSQQRPSAANSPHVLKALSMNVR